MCENLPTYYLPGLLLALTPFSVSGPETGAKCYKRRTRIVISKRILPLNESLDTAVQVMSIEMYM